MLKHLGTLGLLSMLVASSLGAQVRGRGTTVDETFLLNLQTFNTALGVGARPLGMGGAFIAVADDATAASWNPAGLALLIRPEVSVVVDRTVSKLATSNWIDTDMTACFQLRRDPSQDEASGSGLSFLSAAYPVKVDGRRSTIQLSYHREVRPLDVSLDTLELYGSPPPDDFAPGYFARRTLELKATGGLDTLSVGFGTTVSSKVLVGATLNYWFGSMETVRTTRQRFGADVATQSQSLDEDSTERIQERTSLSGVSANVGVLYRPLKWISVGAVYRSGWLGRATSTYQSSITGFKIVAVSATVSEPRPVDDQGSAEATGSISWPAAFGLGVALRPFSTLVLSADVTRQEWSRGSIDAVPLIEKSCEFQGRTYVCRPSATTPRDPRRLNYPSQLAPGQIAQRDQDAIRVGGEYVFFLGPLVVPIRAGYYQIDSISPYFETVVTTSVNGRQTPNPGQQVLRGYTAGFSLGLGGFSFDAAFVYDISSDDREQLDPAPIVSGHRELTNTRFLAALTYRF